MAANSNDVDPRPGRGSEFQAGRPKEDLSDHDRSVLDFAKSAPRHPGHLLNGIREAFNYSETTYFMKLNRLLDDPRALEYDAQTVNRYRRLRDERLSNRSMNQPQ